MKKGDQFKLGDYTYVCIPKGTRILTTNPNWDGDKPETHINLEVILQEDANCVCIGSGANYYLVEVDNVCRLK